MHQPIESKREPVFGEGAKPFFVQLIGLGASCVLILAVLMVGRAAYSSVGETLFGKPQQTAPHLEPGQSAVINGVTIKRID